MKRRPRDAHKRAARNATILFTVLFLLSLIVSALLITGVWEWT